MTRNLISPPVSSGVGGLLTAVALCTLPQGNEAFAQTRSSDAGIEEIIVTAQRREESLQ
jgi:hypothetical protein